MARTVRAAAVSAPQGRTTAAVAVAALRVAGLVAVALVTLRGAAARADPWLANLTISFGVACLVGFLWLTATGFFGYGSARRSDWIGLVPFAVALVVREILTRHSLAGIEVQFATQIEVGAGPSGKHSVVYPLLQMFLVPIVQDPQWLTMHLNGVLGAFASLALYLFVRQRTGSRTAGFLCALFLATHPLVVRFSPTDGPYSLLLATWFSGLAMLSAPDLDARMMLGGAGLLGIAATLRLEGLLLLVGSLVMLDGQGLIDGVRRHRTAAVCSLMLLATLVAVQMWFFLPSQRGGTLIYLPQAPVLRGVVRLLLWPITHNGPVFTALVVAGIASGILTRRRFGLFVFIAMLLVVAPVVNSAHASGLHRLIPACALQSMLAAIGAYGATAWAFSTRRMSWLAVAPSLAAFYILLQNQGDLTRPYVFSEEYDLVRARLVANGAVATDCALMTFRATDDEDIHDFGAVVPGMSVLDCRSLDCLAQLQSAGCFYYLRSAVSYFHDAGLPAACEGGDGVVCLNEPSAAFERSVDLQPVEVRTIDIRNTFQEYSRNYPQRAEIGLFRVRPKRVVRRPGPRDGIPG